VNWRSGRQDHGLGRDRRPAAASATGCRSSTPGSSGPLMTARRLRIAIREVWARRWPPEFIQLVTCSLAPAPTGRCQTAPCISWASLIRLSGLSCPCHAEVAACKFASGAGIRGQPDALTLGAALWHNSFLAAVGAAGSIGTV
jgi:hypothetical protein